MISEQQKSLLSGLNLFSMLMRSKINQGTDDKAKKEVIFIEGNKKLALLHGHYSRFKTSHAEFAKNDPAFIEICGKLEIKATSRQASKWRMKRGLAWDAFVKSRNEGVE